MDDKRKQQRDWCYDYARDEFGDFKSEGERLTAETKESAIGVWDSQHAIATRVKVEEVPLER